MRSLRHIMVLLLAGAGCSSGGSGVDQDAVAAVDVVVAVDAEKAQVDGVPSVLNPVACVPSGTIGSQTLASCQAADTHYVFDWRQGGCEAAPGCDDAASLFDTLASCETKCALYLKCSCDSAVGSCDSVAGACGTCPVLSMDSFLPNQKAIVMSGQPCSYAGLNCHATSGTSSVSGVCTCGADGNWSCVPPASGCDLC